MSQARRSETRYGPPTTAPSKPKPKMVDVTGFISRTVPAEGRWIEATFYGRDEADIDRQINERREQVENWGSMGS